MCIINTPGWKSLIAAGTVVTLPVRGDARGRTDEKFAPFALSRNSSSATHPRVCDGCLQCTGLDNILNWYPYLKRPILHIKAAPRAIRQRLSNKSSYGSNKGFKSETSSTVWAASWGERRGAFYKHSLFSGVSLFRRQSSPNIEAKLWHKLPWWLQINDLYHSESTRLGETDMQNIFTINCSVVYTRTPCRS